ncbi:MULTISPECIES: hypothetical protein [Streptomyces]|uniref:Secreted protein n=1 Tax=Streptomyces sudanensis TaxID=436397 RepID=A0ABY4TF87_9ACTN|nr:MULTISPECIES: hypothetical protein [Streptomyces]MCP9956552.1 hypothetical protein [Streptomyces sudanensis]MCP9985748.1 hypothetical protein [Streptomyces sudanensis]MCQ0002843.1 hypothetical protein [Streptomyces sudanensis]URN17601.1 hypothetical protein MW084_18515 [Streptomyces sudanensis]
MDVTAVLVALLLPVVMLAVVMAMAGYEDLVLRAEPADPATEAEGRPAVEGGEAPSS